MREVYCGGDLLTRKKSRISPTNSRDKSVGEVLAKLIDMEEEESSTLQCAIIARMARNDYSQ